LETPPAVSEAGTLVRPAANATAATPTRTIAPMAIRIGFEELEPDRPPDGAGAGSTTEA
jgi:hypothetical protein